ncbi:type ISP restriction/modification enzyme [Brevundimonas sp. FT23028]|uniref:type ISP restriction/modification enzyme n=1 Tax=Brevundimonas sp. FT23028 TaxID=3393748 RepID=UPI003B58AA7C
MQIDQYLAKVQAQYQSGQATEHSYRPALNELFQSIDPALTVINEPKQSEGGMPDFMFQRDGVPIGWAEAKDIDKDVIKLKGYSIEQRKRYEKAYPNLLYTNGVDFEFIRDGEPIHFVSIADFLMGFQPNPEKFEELERHLRLFAEQKPISIRSAARLAEIMAAKAAIIKDEIGIALAEDPEYRSGLGGQFKSFKANLLPALEPDEFADIYAETITYGMFAARFHDDDLTTFSRQEALEKLPASNPFLKGLFEYVAGPGLPKRLTYIVDDLVQVMRASDPQSLFRDFGKFTARNDPFIHFYEDFLAAYNPKKRKSRGVWYTPEPVVDFIVRAVDDVLKTEFGLADGLADTSKVMIDWDTGQNDKKGKPVTEKREVHKVQVLDPATGTGTFLAKAVQLISDRVKKRAPGKWSGYVEQDLLPRLHGFELLMASYAMCHLKLDMQLTESGYRPSAKPPRLSVWLTNSLEPAEREVRDLFFPPLAEEARGASEVKRQAPIMCVIGNPPYSVSSSNHGQWINSLTAQYKRDLNEQNVQPLSDDYVKFMRLAQYFIENNSYGVVGFITNHSYIDGIIHRAMRHDMLKAFDHIHILDLHGSALREERAPEGRGNENVFDIQVGVSVILAVKTSDSVADATVTYNELWGTRAQKGEELFLRTIDRDEGRVEVHPLPFNFFRPLSKRIKQYARHSFSLGDASILKSSGVKFRKDPLLVKRHFETESVRRMVADMATLDGSALLSKYGIEETKDWRIEQQRANFVPFRPDAIRPVNYRVFDRRYTYYPVEAVNRIIPRGDARLALTSHLIDHDNMSLMTMRQTVTDDYSYALVTDEIACHGTFYLGNKGQDYAIPLYVYPTRDARQGTFEQRRINLEPKLYTAICTGAGIDPSDQAGPDDDFRAATGDARPSEVKVFDYIYGVLHSPDYRATYAEFLKIDFPRIPYPPSPDVFRHVSDKGEQLRRLHLMETPAIGETPYPYHGDGDDVVAAGYPKFEGGRVYINPEQYFDAVPEISWRFLIGGYQPAQKWLKDRRGRALSWDDTGHYQKIIKVLLETDRIMKQIELPITS